MAPSMRATMRAQGQEWSHVALKYFESSETIAMGVGGH